MFSKKKITKCLPLYKHIIYTHMKLRTHGSFVEQSRDAEDIVATDVSQGAFDDALAALQTPVALKRIPRSVTIDPMEHIQLPDPGHQHQL